MQVRKEQTRFRSFLKKVGYKTCPSLSKIYNFGFASYTDYQRILVYYNGDVTMISQAYG